MTTRKTDLYERVTKQVMAAIEAGTTSWRMPWHFQPAEAALPTNPVTKRSYRGINVLALWMQAQALDYPTALWATYQQWLQLGAQVKQGEHGTVIVLWKPTGTRQAEATAAQEQEPEPQQRRGLLVRGYTVFNAAQVEGYTPEISPTLSPEARIEQGEAFFAALGADIRHGGNEAYYQLETDHIQLPPFRRFVDPVSYYGVLAHEVTHWSGAPARLGRNLTARFGSAYYAAEELVAELGAAFLVAHLGLTLHPRADHAAYIQSWLSLLKSDPKAIFTAASKAQQAADFVISRSELAALLTEKLFPPLSR
jgi:antirestriction protein ArdC